MTAARTEPAIVVRLNGGLGNQLFQFAAARSLAQRCRVRLILDATAFTLPQERRAFALRPYPIAAEVVVNGYAFSPTRPLAMLPRPGGVSMHPHGLLDRIAYRLTKRRGLVEDATLAAVSGFRRLAGRSPGLQLRVFREDTFDYDPAFAALGTNIYLDGYWQSYRYFDDVHDLVVRELTLPYEPNDGNAGWLDRIRTSNSVCVHVRRGDYLMSDHFSQHGVCSANYYGRAMRLMTERTVTPHFFVFSDDLDWSRRHISGDNVAFVDANSAETAHDELKLMASCRHHIIANSSLSWWGAWLARHENQIVAAPDPWFSARKRTPDLFPPSWISLPRD